MNKQNNEQRSEALQPLKALLGTRSLKFRVWDINAEHMFEPQTISNGTASHGTRHIIMQFTGHTDTFGNEIYEGDIIDAEYGTGRVELDEVTKQFKYVFDTDSDDLWLYTNDCEVIGNIFENPTLLAECT